MVEPEPPTAHLPLKRTVHPQSRDSINGVRGPFLAHTRSQNTILSLYCYLIRYIRISQSIDLEELGRALIDTQIAVSRGNGRLPLGVSTLQTAPSAMKTDRAR